MAAHAKRLGVQVKPGYGWGKLLLEIFEKTVEHTLVQPTFITEHPGEVSPLARANDTDPGMTDRFELFIGGKELANGFFELNNPEDQAARFMAQVRSEEHTSELQSLMRTSSAVFCLIKTKTTTTK